MYTGAFTFGVQKERLNKQRMVGKIWFVLCSLDIIKFWPYILPFLIFLFLEREKHATV